MKQRIVQFADVQAFHAPLSGAFRPGLIEADRKFVPAADASARYPGHFAPASLKLPSSPDMQRERTGYPGHFAPASLKPGLRPELPGDQLGYPGHFAPASLKRDGQSLIHRHP